MLPLLFFLGGTDVAFSASEVFKYALKNGIMDYDDALESMIFTNLKGKVAEVHQYSIGIGSFVFQKGE